MRAPRGLTAARTASREAHARLQALGSPVTASRSRNTAATAGRRCRCFANQSACKAVAMGMVLQPSPPARDFTKFREADLQA